ncbi:MAG: hypothetical protein ACT4PV_16615 [Planctomycetaceae bacterium]
MTIRFRVFTHSVTLTEADVCYRTAFAPGTLQRDFRPESGHWEQVEAGLTGRIETERAAACWHAERFPGNVVLRFTASTVAPHARDIICYWSAAGTIYGEGPRDCYIAGLGGWWGEKHGLERYPEGGWIALGPGSRLVPGQRHLVMAGRIEGWQFLFLDGRLIVEALDPAPLDPFRFDRVGLATWASSVLFHDLTIYRANSIEAGRDLAPSPA